jgi:TrmH family RNA methyltransferase
MLSKSQISLLKSLQLKKSRAENGVFLVEGYKSVSEFINSSYHVETVFYSPSFASKLPKISNKINFQEISAPDLEKISSLKTPQEVIGLVKIPKTVTLEHSLLRQKFSLVLDGVQDPGNMGTIIRTADWFGIEHIICSEDTVDVYNPKVVQATMGSLARVNVHYMQLTDVINRLKLPVFGALLNGQNIYNTNFGTEGLVIMGNEGNGIRPQLQQLITAAVTIPRVGKAESLNVAMATTIFCSEIRRNSLK